jgi:hypothetical protein
MIGLGGAGAPANSQSLSSIVYIPVRPVDLRRTFKTGGAAAPPNPPASLLHGAFQKRGVPSGSFAAFQF